MPSKVRTKSKMGKIAQVPRQSQNLKSRSTTVIKQTDKKAGFSRKRLLMIRRRLKTLLAEKSSWEEKNKQLSDKVKAEQLLTATFRKEAFHWQRMYHENDVVINSLKVKQYEMAQVLTACLKECDAVYPHFVGISSCLSNNKVRMSNFLKQINATVSGFDCLPRNVRDNNINYDPIIKTGKPIKQSSKVGPMVKGMQIITKPKIMLERIMLPLTQEQDPVNNEELSPIEVNNPLTPIQEENEPEEETCLRHVSVRPKRPKLGRSWRVRRQEQIGKERDRERNKPLTPEENTSSDSDSNTGNEHVEPVVRFRDVTRLLQNSSLVKVDSTRPTESENNAIGSRAAEDPLEGTSWMHRNHTIRSSHRPRPSVSNERRSSLHKSDSSDDEENVKDNEIITERKVQDMNTLVIQNQTFSVPPRESNDLSTVTLCNRPSSNSEAVEPDSTNNVEVAVSDNSSKSLSKKSTLSRNSSSSENAKSLSTEYETSRDNVSAVTLDKSQKSLTRDSLSIRLSKVPDCITIRQSRNSSESSKRPSLSGNGSSLVEKSLEIPEKRSRKPKKHLYPGEEESPPQGKSIPVTKKIPKLSCGRKSFSEIRKSVAAQSNKNIRLSRNIASKSSGYASGGSSNETKGKKKSEVEYNTERNSSKIKRSLLKQNLPTPRSSMNENQRVSVDCSSNETKGKKMSGVQNNKEKTRPKAKNSVMKKSIHTPRSSMNQYSQAAEIDSVNRPRRNHNKVSSYKESPLNTKKRRPV